ncbi:MAG: cytochrome C oxidase subunit IV family protein [Candidatus Polarisedimenticolaceae bacterium]|nr:cytochrome C oxidase subunit IV family protein [Candidatus Polarisedimenticolaceae bacterium]
MSHMKTLSTVWLVLMTITLISAYIAEAAEPSTIITLFIALSIGIKGKLVVDHFMGLSSAHPRLRSVMNAYFYVLPSLIVLVFLFPETIAELTQL